MCAQHLAQGSTNICKQHTIKSVAFKFFQVRFSSGSHCVAATAQAFSFVSVATSKAVKAAKTAQLFNIYGQSEAAIGDAFAYEADGKQYRVEVVDKHRADGR